MDSITLKSWGEFRGALETVQKQYGTFEVPLQDGTVYRRKNWVLFRGQSDGTWGLQTTLERNSDRQFDVLKYLALATNGVTEIESLTGQRWDTKYPRDLKEEIDTHSDSCRVHLPHYDYLVYLRQLGFPSPLLDWTESPYIAAYFAYLDARRTGNVAVYCYIERIASGKTYSGGEPLITVKGPYVRTHPRHFAQKAQYTIATNFNSKENSHYFCSHELVFGKQAKQQDVLVKIELPADARKTALEELNNYNINHFTLFQTHESLVKTLELKAFILGQL